MICRHQRMFTAEADRASEREKEMNGRAIEVQRPRHHADRNSLYETYLPTAARGKLMHSFKSSIKKEIKEAVMWLHGISRGDHRREEKKRKKRRDKNRSFSPKPFFWVVFQVLKEMPSNFIAWLFSKCASSGRGDVLLRCIIWCVHHAHVPPFEPSSSVVPSVSILVLTCWDRCSSEMSIII